MSSPVHSYVRTHRREWALTQKELTYLLGRKSSTYISRLEKGERIPCADILFACEMLFDAAPRALFPNLYAEIEEKVLARAAMLYEELERDTSNAAARKKELLAAVLKRAIIRLNEIEGV